MSADARRAERRRAALYLAQLRDLLEGFPDGPPTPAGQPWRAFPRDAAPAARVIDRAVLTRATRVLTKLRGEYREAVALLVADADRWLATIAATLDRLKAPVHHGLAPEPPPPPRAEPADLPPVAAPLALALRWTLALRPDALTPALRFAAAHVDPLAARPLPEAVRLVLLALADPGAARAWLAALAVPPVPAEADVRHHRNVLLGACRIAKAPGRPPAPPPASETPLSTALAQRPLADLARAGPILAALTLALADAAAHWAEVLALHAAITERFTLGTLATQAQERRARELNTREPCPDGVALAVAALRLAAEPTLAAPLSAALRALAPPDAARFVRHWARLLGVLGPPTLAAALEATADHVAAGRGLGPWANIGVHEHVYGTPEVALVEDDLLPRDFGRYLEALAVARADGRSGTCVAAIVAVDPTRAVARARALAALGAGLPWVSAERAALAHRLAGDDAHAFADLLRSVAPEDAAPLTAAVDHLLTAGVARPGVLALVRDDRGRARRLGRALRLARRLRAPLATPPAPASGAAPASAPAPDAPPTPDPAVDPHAGLAAELAWLVAHGGPPARIAALERRLATSPAPTVAQRAKAAVRQARAAAIDAADRAQAEADAAIARGLVDLFAPGPCPPWAASEQGLVAALLALRSPYRELGLDLLRRRAGPPPWDLRDHPRNQAFLARVRPLLRALDPWLDGVRWDLPRGRTAALDPDPLAVLHMGEPFGTCLAPGACNFFSAVVNAADVDKRVLFVRDARGATVGRCLLVLTAHGGLVTHRVYDATGQGLDATVAELVKDLCDRLGLVPLPRADVGSLVAPEWYDDGAVPLVRGAPQLGLERALATVPFDLTAVAALFPGVPEPLWLAAVLATPESARPEVLRALRPRLLAADLAPADRVLAARGFLGLDDPDAADRVLGPVVLDLARRALTDHTFDDALVAVGLSTHPVGLLRVLRERRRARTLHDEVADYWIGRCLEVLGRPRQALAAWANLEPTRFRDLAERRARLAR